MLCNLNKSSWGQATGQSSTGWGSQGLFLGVENILRWAVHFQAGAMSSLKGDSCYSILCPLPIPLFKIHPIPSTSSLALPNYNNNNKKKKLKYIWGKHCFGITQESFSKPHIWKAHPYWGLKRKGGRADTPYYQESVSTHSPKPPSHGLGSSSVRLFSLLRPLSLSGCLPSPFANTRTVSPKIIHNEAWTSMAHEAHGASFICICILTRSKGVILELWEFGN